MLKAMRQIRLLKGNLVAERALSLTATGTIFLRQRVMIGISEVEILRLIGGNTGQMAQMPDLHCKDKIRQPGIILFWPDINPVPIYIFMLPVTATPGILLVENQW